MTFHDLTHPQGVARVLMAIAGVCLVYAAAKAPNVAAGAILGLLGGTLIGFVV